MVSLLMKKREELLLLLLWFKADDSEESKERFESVVSCVSRCGSHENGSTDGIQRFGVTSKASLFG
jgi:hypothetical protein